MKKLFVLILIFTFQAQAQQIKAMVRVLEAPIFEEPDELSKIVQYARKGDMIYLHPSTNKETRYDNLRPEPISDKEILKRTKQTYQDEYPDPLFKDNFYYYDHSDLYYMTLTDRSRPGFILKKHVAVQYEDIRELGEEKMIHDPTDYRISEPLPEGYPLERVSGYKGMFSFGMGTSTRSSYDYPTAKINDESNGVMELGVVWSTLVRLTELNRLYFGWTGTYNSNSKTVNFSNGSASEDWTQLGAGPYLSYDIWRNMEKTITGYIGFTYNFINSVDIEQTVNGTTETASFDGASFTARTGIYYKVRNLLGPKADIAFGVNFNIEPPTKMSGAVDNTNGLWSGSDFTTKLLVDTTLFIGIQSDY